MVRMSIHRDIMEENSYVGRVCQINLEMASFELILRELTFVSSHVHELREHVAETRGHFCHDTSNHFLIGRDKFDGSIAVMDVSEEHASTELLAAHVFKRLRGTCT